MSAKRVLKDTNLNASVSGIKLYTLFSLILLDLKNELFYLKSE